MIKKNVDGITKKFIERVARNFDLTIEEATMFTGVFFHCMMEEMVEEGFISAPGIGDIRTNKFSMLNQTWTWLIEPTEQYKEAYLSGGLKRRTRKTKQRLMKMFNEKTRSYTEIAAEFDQTKEY